MAQTGFTPIQLYRTSTPGGAPSAGNLADGELAINTLDEKLYFKNAAGTVKLLAANLTPVANGGTGAATLTANNVLLGNGTSAVQVVAPGTSGNVLTSNGTTWASSALAAGDVTLNGVQTLTNKTIEAGTFTNGYTEETVVANTSTAYTIDLANGSVQYLTLTDNCVYTFPTPVAGKSFILVQKQNGTGSRTVTWPASVKWPGATAPTLTATASKADKFIFTAIDGSSWLGSVAGQNYTV